MQCPVQNKHVRGEGIITAAIGAVGAGAIITISWETNTFFGAGSGLRPTKHKSFSGEEAKTPPSDCICSFTNRNAPMSDFFRALDP